MGDKREKEIRFANITDFAIEQRAEGDDAGKMIIEGYAAVYDSETLIGSEDWGFYERIQRGAFDGADLRDVPLKYNHSDFYPILARTRNKSLTLTTDEKGLKIRAEFLNTQDSKDMYTRIKAGLIDKMSFAFTVAEGGETIEEHKAGETPLRTITKFDRIFDVSVVDTPAYDDTSVYARSIESVETLRNTLESEKTREKRNYELTALIKQYKKGN